MKRIWSKLRDVSTMTFATIWFNSNNNLCSSEHRDKTDKNTLLIIFNTRGTSGHVTEPSTADDTLANLYFTTPGNYAKYWYIN